MIAKRPEREFRLGAATVQISARAAAANVGRLLPQWIGYTDIGRESWLSGMYDFLSDRTRPTETWVAGLCYGCGLQSKLTLLLTGSFRRGRIGGEGNIFQEAL